MSLVVGGVNWPGPNAQAQVPGRRITPSAPALKSPDERYRFALELIATGEYSAEDAARIAEKALER